MVLCGTAFAADKAESEQGALETIIVTAQKKAENLQTVPIAITAITAKSIEDAHTVNLEALTGAVPNVQIGHFSNTPTSATFGIRGMSVVDPDPYAGQTVTVVMDGVPLVFNIISLPSLFDVDRVEVLKGPQGTLFGANTIGGVVNIVTAQPTGEFGGKADASFGNYNRIDGNVAFNFPISNTLAGKVTLMHHGQDGYVTNVFNGQSMGNQNDTNGRLYLKWTPNDSFNATVIQEYDQMRDGGPVVIAGDTPADAEYVAPGTLIPGSRFPMYQSPCQPGQRCSAPDTYYSANDTVPDQEYANIYNTTLTMNWASPIGDLVSITGYRRFTNDNYTDQDGTPKFSDATERISNGTQISEEIRDSFKVTDKLQVQFGAFGIYDHYKLEQNFLIQFAAPGLQQITIQNQQRRSESAFFQTYYDITDKLRFQFGGRFTSETTEMRVDILTLIHADGIAKFFGGTSLLNGLADVHAHGQKTWNNGGGKIGLDYKWTDDVLSYVYYARGFKSGGFVGRGLVLQSDIGPFNPEYVDTVELGLKSDWLDHKLRVNAAAFYNKYHNLQIAEIYFTKDAAGNTVNGNTVVNAAQAKTQGIEFDVTAIPIENLKLNASFGYLDAKYTNFPFIASPTLTVDLSGKTLQDAPKFSASGGFAYTIQTGPGETTLGIQDRYVGQNYQNTTIESPRSQIQATNYVDGTLDYQPSDKRWSAGFWVRNITDKRYIASVFDAPGTLGLVNYAPPREFGASIRYHW
jgi:iron complex outermembrane receptor protein